jgi:septation ring formation regulator EzrA
VETRYRKIAGEYKNIESSVKALESRISDVSAQAENLFEEWENEANSISKNQELQSESLRDLQRKKVEFERVHSGLLRTVEQARETLSSYQEFVFAVKHKLNAGTIDEVNTEFIDLSSSIKSLEDRMDTSIADTREYLDSQP